MIDTCSCTPLHVSLGIGLQVVNIIENEAIGLDKKKNTIESQVNWEAYTPVLGKKRGAGS